jgi:ADP-ribose pyrophosphatase YjhB (NUDIX family)
LERRQAPARRTPEAGGAATSSRGRGLTVNRNHEPDPGNRGYIGWEASYEGQLRKLAGQRRLIVPGTRSIVRAESGRVLLIKRRDSGEWGFPAGALELGESILDCCRREVREEAGLDVISAVPMAVYSEPRFCWSDRYGNQRQMLTIVFLVEEWTGEIATRTDETTDCRFFEIDSLPDLPPLYSETLEDLKSYRGSVILK